MIYLCTYVYVLSAALPYLNLHRGIAIQIDRKKKTNTTAVQQLRLVYIIHVYKWSERLDLVVE